MKKIPLLLAALAFAASFAHAQVELVYKTPAETLVVFGMRGTTPYYKNGDKIVRVPEGGRLELRPAKDYYPIQAKVSLTYGVYHGSKEADGTSRTMLTYEQLVVSPSGPIKHDGYRVGIWDVPGRPARLFAREALGNASTTDTLMLKPGEENGVLRMYFFYEGKSIEGLTTHDVKPASALPDMIALKAAIDAGSREDIVAWAGLHPTLAVPNHLLCQIAQWGDGPALDALLTQTASRQNLAGGKGGDALLAAVSANRPETVAVLLKNGVKASQPGSEGRLPMQQAAALNSPERVKQLLQAGAMPDDESYASDATPLAVAINRGSAEVVDVLMAEGAKWPKSRKTLTLWLRDSIPQHSAVNAGRLLAQGAEPNATYGDMDPLLITAAHYNEVEILDALLKAGAKPDAEIAGHVTALMLSANKGNQAAVEHLIAAGATPGRLDKAGQSAACLALMGGHEKLGRWLLDKYTPTPTDLSALLRAALLAENTQLAGELRAKGARLDLSDKQIDDLICNAIRLGDIGTVKEALAAGYNPNKQVRPEWTVAGVAKRYKQPAILETLKAAAGGTLAVKIPPVSKLPVSLVFNKTVFAPEELQAAGIYGEAKVDLMIDNDGHPCFPLILAGSDPRMNEPARTKAMYLLFNRADTFAWRRVIVPITFAKPDAMNNLSRLVYYPWELDRSATAVDQPAESWSFVRTQPVSLVAATFVVSNEGEVVNPRVAGSGAPEVNAQALDAMRGWKYRPGVRGRDLVWSYKTGYIVMPGLRRIESRRLYPIDELAAGAEAPRLLKAGSAQQPDASDEPACSAALLRFTVGPDGKAGAITLLASSNEPAAQAAKARCESAVYEPGKIDGKPVAMVVVQCIPLEDSSEKLWDGY